MPLNLFIIGPSGCGKSTQAKLIADKYNLTHFSTGQILRDEIASGSSLGIEAKKYIEKGVFCPDIIVIPIVENILKTIDFQNFILDGTPRRLDQALAIQSMLKQHDQKITLIIHLDVTSQEIVNRRAKQEKLGNQFQDLNRPDNSPEAVIERQKQYNELNQPILDHFQESNLLLNVDGNRPIEPIFEDMVKKIDTLQI